MLPLDIVIVLGAIYGFLLYAMVRTQLAGRVGASLPEVDDATVKQHR